SLAATSDPDMVIPTIIRTLGLPESSSTSPFKHLVSYLYDKQFLLLLDNFEHLLPAAALLAELLVACPQLKVLVTSRVSLHVQGEYEFEVLPLAVPDLRSSLAYETLAQMASVELFVQRVEALKPHFWLNEDNAAIIAEICVRLEGLPLAIELAAARTKLLSLKALLSRLDDSLEVLSSGRQDVPSRQQTLRNMIAWSYDLLSAEQRMLFWRLCVFVGDFTLEAAETVVSALGGTDVSVLDGIASLIDCNLLRCREEEGHEPRLHILATVRAFGLERLAASGELERCWNAHAAYYLALAEDEAALDSATQIAQLELLEREYENIRAAMQWLQEHHETEAALRLAASLRLFWFFRGYLNEGCRRLEQVLELSGEDDTEDISKARAKALFALGFLSFFLQDSESATVLLQESLASFRRYEDKRGIADSLRWLGTLIHNRGEMEKGTAMVKESLSICREIGEDGGRAESLLLLGVVAALVQGKYDQASKLCEESLVLYKAMENPWRTAISLHYLAMAQIGIGEDIAYAFSLSEESLELLHMFRSPYLMVEVLTVCAFEATVLGEETKAKALLEEASALARRTENTEDLAHVLWGLGHLALRQGDLTEARERYIDCVKKVGGKQLIPRLNWVVASCLEGLAEIAVAQGQPTWAIQLLGTAKSVRSTYGYYSSYCIEQPFFDHTLSAARNKLSEKNFAMAWEAGLTMTPEQSLNTEAQPPSRKKASLLPPTMSKSVSLPTASNELTAREVEVLTLVAMGMSNRQIAEQLVLSPNTVNTHIQSIYNKLNVG
ncbi:MAG TPA: LuxR C-terminal-related transcriptional regulator, partial [Ktedonobacteraceae bacterium]